MTGRPVAQHDPALDQARRDRAEAAAVHGAGAGVVGFQPPAGLRAAGRPLDQQQARIGWMPRDHDLAGADPRRAPPPPPPPRPPPPPPPPPRLPPPPPRTPP